MIKDCAVLVVVIVWILFSAGCAYKPSRMEMNFGTSFYLSKFNQVLDPEAGKSLEPVSGLDGQAA